MVRQGALKDAAEMTAVDVGHVLSYVETHECGCPVSLASLSTANSSLFSLQNF